MWAFFYVPERLPRSYVKWYVRSYISRLTPDVFQDQRTRAYRPATHPRTTSRARTYMGLRARAAPCRCDAHDFTRDFYGSPCVVGRSNASSGTLGRPRRRGMGTTRRAQPRRSRRSALRARARAFVRLELHRQRAGSDRRRVWPGAPHLRAGALFARPPRVEATKGAAYGSRASSPADGDERGALSGFPQRVYRAHLVHHLREPFDRPPALALSPRARRSPVLGRSAGLHSPWLPHLRAQHFHRVSLSSRRDRVVCHAARH